MVVFCFSLGRFHFLLLFFCLAFVLFFVVVVVFNRAGVFVGNSEAIAVPPVFPFCSPCLPCQWTFNAGCDCSHFSSSAFITSSFLLRICVCICLFC